MRTISFGQYGFTFYSHSFMLALVEERESIPPFPSPLLFISPHLSSAPQTSRYSLCTGSGWSPLSSPLHHPSSITESPSPYPSPVFTFTVLWSASSPARSISTVPYPTEIDQLGPKRCFKAPITNQGSTGLQEGLDCKNSAHQDPDHCLAWPRSR